MPLPASPAHKDDYTKAKLCLKCRQIFYKKSDWGFIIVKCPHCGFEQ